MNTSKTPVVKKRPAESGGIAAAIALLIAYAVGLDNPGVITAVAVVIGFVPAAITWLVVTIRNRPSAQ